jgi:hypothetical protein
MLMGRFAEPDRPADLSHAVLPRARWRLRPRLSIRWFRAGSRHGRGRLELKPMTQVNGINELMTQIHDA